MKIRILEQVPGVLNGLRMGAYRVGQAYDLPAEVAQYLVAEGFAIVEMRTEPQRPFDGPDRRRSHAAQPS